MQTGPDSDRALAERLNKGEEAAFNLLLDRYKRPVLNFLYRLMGDAAEAEDAAQDVFVRVYRHLGQYRFRSGNESCSSWIFQIARNEAIDRLRRRARRPEASFEASGMPERAQAPGAGADAETSARDIGAHIASAAAALPEDQRTAFVLAEYQGLSHAEIAAVMDCSGKSVEARLHRARQFLRRRLAFLLE